jgi:hypothetical protein
MEFTFLDGKYSRIQSDEEYRALFAELYNILEDEKNWEDNKTVHSDLIYDEKYAILEQFHHMIGLATELTDILSFRRQWNNFIWDNGKELFAIVNKLLVLYIEKKLNLKMIYLDIPEVKIVYEHINGNYAEMYARTIDFDEIKKQGDIILPITRKLVKVWKEFVWTDLKIPSLTGDERGLVKPPAEYYNMLFDPKSLQHVNSHNTQIVEQISVQVKILKDIIQNGGENIQQFRNNIANITETSDYITFSNIVMNDCCGVENILENYPNLIVDLFMYYYFPDIGIAYDSKDINEKPFDIENLKKFLNNLSWSIRNEFAKASLIIDEEPFIKYLSYNYDDLIDYNLEFIINTLNIEEYDSDEYDSDEYDSDGEQDLSWMDLSFLTNLKNRLLMPHPPNECVERDSEFLNNLTVYDFMVLEDTPVKEYIKEDPKNIVVFIDKSDGLEVHGGFNKNQLQKIVDKNDFFYECAIENESIGVKLDQIDHQKPLVLIKGLQGNLYVSVFDLSKLLKSSMKYWLIQPIGREAEYTTGIETLNVGRGQNYMGQSVLEAAVSADHCQDRSNKSLYTLLPLKFIGEDDMSISENNEMSTNDNEYDNEYDSDNDSIEMVSGNVDDPENMQEFLQEFMTPPPMEGGNIKKKCNCKKCQFKRMVL